MSTRTKRQILDHIEFEGLKAASKGEWCQVVYWANLYRIIYYNEGYIPQGGFAPEKEGECSDSR